MINYEEVLSLPINRKYGVYAILLHNFLKHLSPSHRPILTVGTSTARLKMSLTHNRTNVLRIKLPQNEKAYALQAVSNIEPVIFRGRFSRGADARE